MIYIYSVYTYSLPTIIIIITITFIILLYLLFKYCTTTVYNLFREKEIGLIHTKRDIKVKRSLPNCANSLPRLINRSYDVVSKLQFFDSSGTKETLFNLDCSPQIKLQYKQSSNDLISGLGNGLPKINENLRSSNNKISNNTNNASTRSKIISSSSLSSKRIKNNMSDANLNINFDMGNLHNNSNNNKISNNNHNNYYSNNSNNNDNKSFASPIDAFKQKFKKINNNNTNTNANNNNYNNNNNNNFSEQRKRLNKFLNYTKASKKAKSDEQVFDSFKAENQNFENTKNTTIKKEQEKLFEKNFEIEKEYENYRQLQLKLEDVKLELDMLINHDKLSSIRDKATIQSISNNKAMNKRDKEKIIQEKLILMRQTQQKQHLMREDQYKIKKKEFKLIEDEISIIKGKLDDLKAEKEVIKRVISVLKDELLVHYHKILSKGTDVRKEGLSWVIQEIWNLGEKVQISFFPKYFDEFCVQYLFKVSIIIIYLNANFFIINFV